MPNGSARVVTTSMVWGKQSLSTKNRRDFDFDIRWHKAIASAAAVPSSNMEALAISMPVRSVIIV